MAEKAQAQMRCVTAMEIAKAKRQWAVSRRSPLSFYLARKPDNTVNEFNSLPLYQTNMTSTVVV